ncbi:MAG: hypothetical protein E4H14_03930 [Candidatus Thorarchaeota archaeon]|nr:MAG: hypothetical protein E4H14_03930 [Candidatus Thorarchaeota archaeon]
MSMRFTTILLIAIICLGGLQTAVEMDPSSPATVFLIPCSEYYTTHEPISIDSDQDFVDNGFSGNGSLNSPYIIEGLNITSSIFMGSAISVRDTYAHFVIRDCYILSAYIGILVVDAASGTGSIENNTCLSSSGDGGGISVGMDNCTISRNRCMNWGQGIHLNDASRCLISSNNISDSTYQGINIRYSDNNTISGNRILNSSQHGLLFVGTSSFNVAYNNTFIENGNVAMYNIDGERTGNLISQGYDEGSNNVWHDIETETGNLWSDYSGNGSYAIDGPANNVDLYPIKYQPFQDNSDTIITIILIASISALAVILVLIGYRRLNK